MDAHCTVVLAHTICVDFDETKVDDNNYLEQKRIEAKTAVAKKLGCMVDELILTDSSVAGLIE